MSSFKKICFVVLALFILNGLNAQVYSVTPDYDAFYGYHDGSPTSGQGNGGTYAYNNVYAIESAFQPGGLNVTRTALHFDLTGLPVGVTINSATLDLYGYGPVGTVNGHEGVNCLGVIDLFTQTWTETGITWLTEPSATSAITANIPTPTSSTEDFIGLDVTNLVQEMLVSGNFGFRIRQNVEQARSVYTFCSREHADSSKWPRLTINYSTSGVTCIDAPIEKSAQVAYHDGSPNPWGQGNGGAAEAILPYTIPSWYQPTTGLNVSRNLVKFDLSGIPANMNIVSATMDLYGHGPIGTINGHEGTSDTCIIERVTQFWDEMSVTFVTQPTVVSNNSITLPTPTSPSEDYLGIDMTGLVTDMYLYGNEGFRMKMINEVPYNTLVFCSEDYTDTLKHPQLEVCYDHSTESLIELEKEINVLLYPNPSTENVTLAFERISDYELVVHNALGQVVMKKSLKGSNQYQFDIADWGRGVYFFTISDAVQQRNLRFIKQ